jgi:hypothetical protein
MARCFRRERASVGAALTMQNIQIKEEIICPIGDCGAKKRGVANVGVEFGSPRANFLAWAFPPAGWCPRSAEAKPYRRQVVKNPPAAET